MNKIIRNLGWLGALILLLAACAPSPPPPERQMASEQATRPAPEIEEQVLSSSADVANASVEPLQLPVRFQRPSYVINEPDGARIMGEEEDVFIKVGADISTTTGPVPLRDIIKRLAALKKMNISWASDVDQKVMVEVDIRAEDDFFKSIDNILRQVDYFHELHENSIIIKYKETRRYHIAMPFIAKTYAMGVGGNILGGKLEVDHDLVKGSMKLYSEGNKFDIWENIAAHLDQILEIWVPREKEVEEDTQTVTSAADSADAQPATQKEASSTDEDKDDEKSSKAGYYSIDKPVGLITVTAPRPLLEKVDNYIESLKKQLYRQVSIEAKILEVTLSDSSTKGIDWTDVLSNVNLDFQLFGPNGIIYSAEPSAQFGRVLHQISTPDNPFTMVLDAIEQQGRTKILANPKISVMNGQPALINVGETVRYIDSIESKANEGGVVTFTVNTDSLMSGLALSVVPTIMENDEIILSLTPVTSQLLEPIDEVQIGLGTVMLPRVRLREMSTLVRIKDGGMLVVGGLIDEQDVTKDTKVPMLGNLPVINKLFKSENKNNSKTELVILLRPQII